MLQGVTKTDTRVGREHSLVPFRCFPKSRGGWSGSFMDQLSVKQGLVVFVSRACE